MRRQPSHFGRTVVLAAAVCALGVAAGCGRETFDLLPDATLDGAGRGSTAGAGHDSGGAGSAGRSSASGKGGGGTGGKAEAGGFGGRFTTFPGGGSGVTPCLGEGGCPDEEPASCSLGDPFCTPCRYNSQCVFTNATTCDQELRRCVECRKESQCGPGERCNTNTWRCAKACGGSKDTCGVDGQHMTCSSELGVCVACTSKEDCNGYGPFSGRCSPSNVCVECFEDAQCGSEFCLGGRCIAH